MTNKRPIILVTNDDGYLSEGIQFLIHVMREVGEVFVVAPESNRSGMSHAMTLYNDIYIEPIKDSNNDFICSGTPVDCVKVAVNKILPRLPDLCVSGINHGSNHSINALYSGTLHAALEGALQGVKSISFSHLSYEKNIDFTSFHNFIKTLSLNMLANNISNDVVLNVNLPDTMYSNVKGVRVCNQAKGKWIEHFENTKILDNKTFYSIKGQFQTDAINNDTDSWALANNFISIVPININCTDFNIYHKLKYLECDF